VSKLDQMIFLGKAAIDEKPNAFSPHTKAPPINLIRKGGADAEK
jgi:hypothetical protein